MIEREAAVRAVEEQLERDYQTWRAGGAEALRTAVVDVEEHELVWIVYWTSEEFMRTRNPEFMLAGNGPYLVDRVDGGGCLYVLRQGAPVGVIWSCLGHAASSTSAGVRDS
ncbi:YrhB domain-containing protein [Streptomyces sp. NPDC058620]|uniref:YrhB domain-containing protein n=1 Tax=Streptomyces sp. NPDC058620 TaxID=3346560 RepID=UPI00365BAC25